MSQELHKIIAVVGPTASGKSDLAVELALAFSGEVVSADSRQVYRGMDIGTGKITATEMKGVPHHLLDIALPNEIVSAGDYKLLATHAISEILERENLPIICGGTGFYIRAVAEGLVLPDVPPDPILREKLSQLSVDDLFTQLKEVDPERANTIDAKNPHRLIRAIEIATALGKVPQPQYTTPYETLYIGIAVPDEILRARIHTRLVNRLDEGMIEEVVSLQKNGVSWERLDSFGLEYRYIARYLQGLISRENMEKELEIAIIHYAKRQMTWFKTNKNIHWIPLGDTQMATNLVAQFLKM